MIFCFFERYSLYWISGTSYVHDDIHGITVGVVTGSGHLK